MVPVIRAFDEYSATARTDVESVFSHHYFQTCVRAVQKEMIQVIRSPFGKLYALLDGLAEPVERLKKLLPGFLLSVLVAHLEECDKRAFAHREVVGVPIPFWHREFVYHTNHPLIFHSP